MAAKKIKTSHIENLITEYVRVNGIDSNVDKMLGIISKYTEKNNGFEFKDIVFLSYTLNVSPDYITNVSDNPAICDNVLIKIIKNTYALSDDYKNYLADYTEFLNNLYLDNSNHIDSGIKIKVIDKNTMEVISNNVSAQEDDSYISKVAQTRGKSNSVNDEKSKK